MSGLEVTVLKENNGRPLALGDSYVLSYVVALSLDDLHANRYIDSSEWYDRPVIGAFGGDELLPGLTQALTGRCYGDTLRVEIPPDHAFGSRGVPGRVPSSATLYVQIEIAAAEGMP